VHTPGGARHLCWSGAAAVIGHHALAGRDVLLRDNAAQNTLQDSLADAPPTGEALTTSFA
jgi:hypothetical protein